MKKIINLSSIYKLSGLTIALISVNALAAEKIGDQKTFNLNGQSVTITKYVNDNGDVRSETIETATKRKFNDNALPKATTNIVTAELQAKLNETGASTRKFKVIIGLNNSPFQSDIENETGEEEIGSDGKKVKNIKINGKVVNEIDANAHFKIKENVAHQNRINLANRRGQHLSSWAQRKNLSGKDGIQTAANQGLGSVTLELTGAEIKKLIDSNNDESISAIELWTQPKDNSLFSAMIATSITPYGVAGLPAGAALNGSTTKGNGVGIYMTETGCADPANITNYTRLSGTQTDHSLNVGSIIRTVSPNSYLYCRNSIELPSVAELAGINGRSPIRIINVSAVTGARDTTYQTTDKNWDDFSYNNDVPIFIAAGNVGTDNPNCNVTTPGKGLNIITVGNYNDANNAIGTSSCFVDPYTQNAKPEISAPGHDIDAGGVTKTGTSQAAPHAAALAADMISGNSIYLSRPYLLKAKLLAGATDYITGGTDKVGLGGIDFISSFYYGYNAYWTGSNSYFNTIDAQDGAADNKITKTFNIDIQKCKKVRFAISWATRGTYTANNIAIPATTNTSAKAGKIGTDFDLAVYNPSGAYIGGSDSIYNSYEVVGFTPAVSGNYSVKVTRFSNNDTSANFKLGLVMSCYQ